MSRGLLTMVPTRGRPDNVKRFLDSWHASQPESDLVFLDDQECPSLLGDIPLMPFDAGSGMTGVMYRRHAGDPTTVQKLNQCALDAIGRGYGALMFIGDDHVIESKRWDHLLLEGLRARARGTGWAYPADGRRSDVPEICLITADIVKALGWFALPQSRHGYIDHAWSDLAREFDRLVHVPEVMIRHRHYRIDRAIPRDEVYDRGEAWGPGDGNSYLEWRDGGQRERDAGKLRAVCT